MSEDLIPLHLQSGVAYIEARSLDQADDEQEIAALRPALDQVLATVTEFSRDVIEALRKANAPRVAIEFGVEIALESGKLVAIVGKASAKSTLKITLDWAQPKA